MMPDAAVYKSQVMAHYNRDENLDPRNPHTAHSCCGFQIGTGATLVLSSCIRVPEGSGSFFVGSSMLSLIGGFAE